MDWSQLLLNNGLAVGILVAIGGGGWRVVAFLAPLVQKFFDRQNAFLDSLQGTTERQTKILESHGEKLNEIHERIVHGK